MTRDDQLADLLVAWDDAVAAGRPVTPQDLCRGRPELLDPFRRLLAQLGHIGRVFDGPPADPQRFVEQFDAGRYKPLSFHAAGGLGVVAVAEDRELKRPVALKVMQQLAALDPAARQRFLLEAEITGKLEHPGIAPVYGAGEDPAGLPYYAMRFIQGRTLADHIGTHHKSPADPAARRLDFARLLRCFGSVCQTVAYAHARGVLHRDIKPGNVMLGPYGETLLVDWGLAKRFDLPDPTGSVPTGFKPVELKATGETVGVGQTVAGQVKGSPAFMAPEQARGEWDRVGPAADIYALGATLYVLLTGRSPYSGPSVDEVLRAVKAAPPRAVRAVKPDAPKPLAAICAKAMARHPQQRYETAQELAVEVERWLADEPVTAFRDPPFTRARRWVKRNRVLAAAGAAAVLVLTAALAVIAPILTAKNQELAKANGGLNQANTDLTDANARLRAANAAQREDFEEADTTVRGQVELVFIRAVSEPGKLTAALRKDAVQQYRDYLKRFIDRNRDRPEVRLEVAAAWMKLAELDALLDPKGTAADGDAAEAERLFDALKAERPDDPEVLYGWAFAASQRGELLVDRGRLADGLKRLDAARPVFERVAADPAPVRLARMFTVPGVLENTPAFRLAHVVQIAADARRQADRLKAAAVPGGAGRGEDRYRTDLRTVLTLLTADKPLPADAPLFTRIKVLGIRLELAEGEADPAKATAFYSELANELKPLAEPVGASEYKALALEAEIGLAKAELAAAQRKYGNALARKDQAAAEAANKAFDDALSRLGAASLASYDLRRADLGLDPFGLRARAEVVPLEVAFAQTAAVQGMGRASWGYANTAVVHLKSLAEKKDLSAVVAARAIQVVGPFGALAGQSGLRQLAEQAYQHGLVFADRIAAEAPDEPAFVLMKAYLYAGMAGMRAGQQKPIGDAADKAEKLLAALPPDPTDWGPPLCEAIVLTARATEDALVHGKPERAIERLDRMREKITEAVKRGFPEADAELFRLIADIQTAAVLGGQAEDLLNGPGPKDPAKARPLIARAVKLLRTAAKRPPPKDLSPESAAVLDQFTPLRDKMIAELEKLDAQANPKK